MKSLITRLLWIVLLLLPGCESLRQVLPPLPRIDPLVNQSPPTGANTAQSQIAVRMEEEIRQRINQIRHQRGLSQLQRHDRLEQVARSYSQRMAEENFFSHTSPSGDSMVQRVQSAGIFYFVLGENLFKGTNLPEPVSVAVKGWMDSPGHRANILRSEYRETGIGIWRSGNTYYFTQLFLRSF